MFRNILVAFDFGRASERALEVAIDLARPAGARLTILHVCEVPAYAYVGVDVAPADLLTPIAEAGEARLRDLVRSEQARFPGAQGAFRVGVPADEILAQVAEGAHDLVVMGTHGRRGLAHLAIGSVAERIVRTSPVPVLTVRGEPGER